VVGERHLCHGLPARQERRDDRGALVLVDAGEEPVRAPCQGCVMLPAIRLGRIKRLQLPGAAK